VIPREGVERFSEAYFILANLVVIPREGVESEKRSEGSYLPLSDAGDPERGS
jgi:hypothetical protein